MHPNANNCYLNLKPQPNANLAGFIFINLIQYEIFLNVERNSTACFHVFKFFIEILYYNIMMTNSLETSG